MAEAGNWSSDEKKKKLVAFIALDEPVFRKVLRQHDDFNGVLHLASNISRETERSAEFRTETIDKMDDIQFGSNFRMKPSTYEQFLSIVSPLLPKPYDGIGQHIIPPKERLAIALWFLSSRETYRQLATRFGTTESVVHESVNICLNAINQTLDEIKFPETTQECIVKAADFKCRNNYPGIVGAIDGTYINILKPAAQPDIWIDRKGHHSINCALVVDACRRITAVSIGSPGSFHDSRVLRISELSDKIDNLPDEFHVIGDSAYPLKNHLLVPYRDNGNLTNRQRVFNYKHSANRMVVENTIGIIKMKFPRIQSKLMVHSWDRAVSIIMACMQLHNFIQKVEHNANEAEFAHYDRVVLPLDPKDRRDAISDIVFT